MTARANSFVRQRASSLELHINAATSGGDVNAFLRGGKRYNHTSLICHRGACSSTASSDAAHPLGTYVIMTVEILKMLQIINLAESGSFSNPYLAYGQSFYLNWIAFAFVGERPRPPAKSDPGCEGSSAKPQSCVGFPFVTGGDGESRHRAQDQQKNYNFLNIIHGGYLLRFVFGCKLVPLSNGSPLDESPSFRSSISHNACRNTSFLSISMM